MLDVLDHPVRKLNRSSDPLCAPLAVGDGDAAELVCLGWTLDHLRRRRRCAWHLVLHRPGTGECWTHLYRVLPDRGGRVLVLLDQMRPGDARVTLRHHAVRAHDLRGASSGRAPGLRG